MHRLPGHVLAESFLVITRLPHGLSLSAADTTDLLLDAFGGLPLTLGGDDYVSLLRDVTAAGLRGGAIYGAVVAAAAARASAELLTLAARAAGTYRAVGAIFRRVTT